jgi:hypothetical protein
MRKQNLILAAIGGGSLFGLQAAAEPQDPMQRELTQLQTRVAELQSATTAQNTQLAATIDQVLRDAERRTQLLANGSSGAGYENGFYIISGESSFRPGVMFEFRNVTDYRASTSGPKDAETENGFEVRRLELSLDGTLITKNLRYRFYWETQNDAGTFGPGQLYLEDAHVRYMFADAWGVRIGQFKPSFSHEQLLNNASPLAVERSLLDQTLGGGFSSRVQGVNLVYGGRDKDNPWNIEAGMNDGASSKNSNWVGHYPSDPASLGHVGAPSNHAFDFGAAARAEYRPMGSWDNYNEFSVINLKEPLLVLGAGVEWNQGGDGKEIGGTLDVEFKHPCGGALYGAAIVHNVSSDLSATSESFTDWGLMLQASYAINPQWEPFVRWSMVKYDDKIAVNADGESFFHEICIGTNYFLGENGSAGYRARITVDLCWLPNGAPAKMTGLGYLGDSGGDDEVALRAQFTLSL